jgi:TRAP-type C4-dicarboxylate transport system permease small subunit
MRPEEQLPLSWLQPGAGFLLILAAAIGLALVARTLLLRRVGKERVATWNRWVEGGLFVGFLGAMIGLSALQVILRNFFHTGLVWCDPFVRILVLWMAFLGALTATGRARHIRIDALGRMLPPKSGRVLGRVLAVISSIVCAILANGAYVYLREEFLFGVSPFLGIPSWVAQSILLWGFGLLSYRFLVQAIWPVPSTEST